MSDYAGGGVIGGGGPVVVALSDDECVLNRSGECIRDDMRHLFEMIEIRTFGSLAPADTIAGHCLHRACHVVAVDSVLDGETIARLCRVCDTQLPT